MREGARSARARVRGLRSLASGGVFLRRGGGTSAPGLGRGGRLRGVCIDDCRPAAVRTGRVANVLKSAGHAEALRNTCKVPRGVRGAHGVADVITRSMRKAGA